MSNFKKSYELLKKWENRQTKNGLIVYSNIKQDAGGETVLGVARNKNPNLQFWKDVDEIKKEVGTKDLILLSKKILENKKICDEIETLYKNEYWNKAKCNIILNDDFASNLFLLCVNAGVKRGIKTGQEACNLEADGIIGNLTRKAWMTASKNEVKKFTEIEIKYYISLVYDKNEINKIMKDERLYNNIDSLLSDKKYIIKNINYTKFLKGWINRANAI